MSRQGSLFARAEQERLAPRQEDAPPPDLASYDRIVLCTSGGKDSTASFLKLIDLGVEASRIELHHHPIDGAEGSDLFDWPCTESYVARFAEAFGCALSRSWRQGGIEAEMRREDQASAPVVMVDRDGTRSTAGGNGPVRTVRKYPAASSIANGRWCSASGKKDPFARFLANADGFDGARTLVITGERAEEGAARAALDPMRRHACDRRDNPRLRRHVDHWMPIHGWDRHRVWSTLRRHGVVPHPCYFLGIGRASCAYCVFAPAAQLALLRRIDGHRFGRHEETERSFGHTVRHRTTLGQTACRGRAPEADPARVATAMSKDYTGPILVDPQDWVEPSGAFADDAGPT